MYFRIIYVITDFVIHFAEHVKDNVYLYSYIKNPLITPKQLFDYFILWIRLTYAYTIVLFKIVIQKVVMIS